MEDEERQCSNCDVEMERIHTNVENGGAVLLWSESILNLRLVVCPQCGKVEAVTYNAYYGY